MGLAAFQSPGRFHKGNIHTHSTRSDGALTPDFVCKAYAERGYDFLCLSDHFMAQYGYPVVDTSAYRTAGFTTILGAELHAPQNSQNEIWHILACGLPGDFAPLGDTETGVEIARRAAEAGAFVGIAHPQWSSLTIEDGRALAGIAHAVEVYNTGCDVENVRGDGTYLLDQLLSEGHRLTAYAADDAHFKTADAFGGWMMVKAEANEPDALLAAMKAGHFYASRGPIIEDISIDGETLRVRSSPVAGACVVGRGSRAVYRGAPGMTEADLPLQRFAGDWCRVMVMDETGRQAWSNPIHL